MHDDVSDASLSDQNLLRYLTTIINVRIIRQLKTFSSSSSSSCLKKIKNK